MSELDEIMEGIHEIKHLYIEGDTLAFETEMNNHTWNLTPRDIEIIIYCLQNENKKLNNIINKLEDFIEKEIEIYTLELKEKNTNALSYSLPIKAVYKEIYNVLQELKGDESNGR